MIPRTLFYFFPEMVLLGFGLLILCADPLMEEPQKSFLGKATLFALVSGIAATLLLWGKQSSLFGTLYLFDTYSLFFKLVFLGAALVTVAVSSRYLLLTGIPRGEYLALILFATVGMMVMASGTDFLSIYLGLEVMAIASYALVGLLRKERASLEGALKYFLLGAFNSGVILYGIALLYGAIGTTNLVHMGALFSKTPPPKMFLAAIALLTAGLAFKISAFPFHMWVPDAYEGSPTPVAGFISVASKAASFAVLLRISLSVMAPLKGNWQMLVVTLSVMTMTFGNLLALSQESLKRMLAYSSIAHAGYLLIGVAVGAPSGFSAILFYFVAYGLMNLGAFAMIVLIAKKERRAESLEDFRGLATQHPGWALCFLVFLLSLAGIPPSAGFIGKFYLFAGAIQSGLYGLATIAVLNSVLALSYYFRVVRGMYMIEGGSLEISSSWGLRFSLILLALLTLAIGFYPVPFLKASQQAVASLR